MALLDRIANYFKEWDGIDEAAPKMELSIHELRYIANMNVERCRLIRQVNEANLKTEKLLLDNRNRVIDEFLHNAETKICDRILQNQARLDFASGLSVANRIIDEIAEQMKAGGEDE